MIQNLKLTPTQRESVELLISEFLGIFVQDFSSTTRTSEVFSRNQIERWRFPYFPATSVVVVGGK